MLCKTVLVIETTTAGIIFVFPELFELIGDKASSFQTAIKGLIGHLL